MRKGGIVIAFMDFNLGLLFSICCMIFVLSYMVEFPVNCIFDGGSH